MSEKLYVKIFVHLEYSSRLKKNTNYDVFNNVLQDKPEVTGHECISKFFIQRKIFAQFFCPLTFEAMPRERNWKLSKFSVFSWKYFSRLSSSAFWVSSSADILKFSIITDFRQCLQHGIGRNLQQLGFSPSRIGFLQENWNKAKQ